MEGHGFPLNDGILRKLTNVLHVPVTVGKASKRPTQFSDDHDGPIHFIPVPQFGADTGIWIAGALTEREQALIRLFVAQAEEASVEQADSPLRLVVDWIRDVARARRVLPLPPSVKNLDVGMRVPFCIAYHTYESSPTVGEFEQVLHPFFSGDVIVLSVMPGQLFLLSEAECVFEEGEDDDWQDGLIRWGEGLVDVLRSELGVDIDVIVHPMVGRVLDWGTAWMTLQEAYRLGKGLFPSRHVFATWNMTIARLLHAIPRDTWDVIRQEIAAADANWWQDGEMRKTVRTFFQLNLNVSETARKLYIHRNTLLYRLEKVKQETGRDLRQFEDAVLIYVGLLMTEAEQRVD